MREFERTGIYPEYLLFNLPGTRHNWKIKIKEKPQKGYLRSGGTVLYQYEFDEEFCRYRKMKKDGNFSAWIAPDSMTIEMRD